MCEGFAMDRVKRVEKIYGVKFRTKTVIMHKGKEVTKEYKWIKIVAAYKGKTNEVNGLMTG